MNLLPPVLLKADNTFEQTEIALGTVKFNILPHGLNNDGRVFFILYLKE